MIYRGVLVGLAAAVLAPGADTATPSSVTFHKDVLPVLQRNCQGCHRPGEAAPMSLLRYSEARPWAKAIKEAVLSKRMPPWFADLAHGKFSNDRSLSRAEISTLVAWADSGAKEGDPKDALPPRKFLEGWNIGLPDLVVEMPNEYVVPAAGTIEYTYYVLPMNLTEDRWVQMAEVRPGNRAVVHHVIAFIRGPNSKWLREAKPGEPYVPRKRTTPDGQRRDEGQGGGEFLVGYAPGTVPEVLKPGEGKLIKAGSDVVFQMHYTANGKAAADKTKVGVIFAKEPPAQRVLTAAAQNRKFVIPAGAPNHRVDAEITFQDSAILTAFLPHMHLRGKSFEYRLVYPTGESQILLRVPKYDFNWQLSYYLEKPLLLTKGTKIECTAYFDNSPNNPANPNPNTEVRWGDQSWEEMMIGFFDLAIDVKADAGKLFKKEKENRTGDD
jgi:hypothetical protein